MKIAEDKLTKDELHQLFDNITLGIALCELIIDNQGKPQDYRFLKVNTEFEKQTSLSISSVIGKTAKEIYPDIEDSWIKKYGAVVLNNEPIHFFDYNQNTNRHYGVQAFPITNKTFAIYFEDISEKRKSDEALKKSENRYEVLFNSIEEMLTVVEMIYDKNDNPIDYYIRQINPSFSKFLGEPQDKLINKKVSSIIGTIEDYWLSAFSSVDKTGKTISFEEYGAEFDKHYKVKAWKLTNNNLAISFTDITEQKHSEEKINSSLQKEIELGKLKSKFIGTASHQFRTPLTVIQSCLGILDLQKKLPNAEFKASFEKRSKIMLRQIKSLTKLMSNLLILEKANTGSTNADLQPTDIVSLVKEVVHNCNQISNNQEKLCVQISGDSFLINLDANLMEHALSNIISNALKFSSEKLLPKVTIEFKELAVLVIVQDYGIGIPETDLPLLFEPFYRASNSNEIPGTGIGSSIAKEYIELNNGTLEVESEINVGSKFIISIRKNSDEFLVRQQMMEV